METLPEKPDFFPKKLTAGAAILAAALVVGAGSLIASMHRDLAEVSREQVPLLEMASINVRLAHAIELETEAALASPGRGGAERLSASLDSLDFNLKAFREALERSARFRDFIGRVPSGALLAETARIRDHLAAGRREAARTAAAAPSYRADHERFVAAIGDLTEALGQARDERLARQLRSARLVAVSAAVLLLVLLALAWRIRRAYRFNLGQRLAAEARAQSLSLQRRQLIHVLCHDLGNPVASITGFGDYLAAPDEALRANAVSMVRKSAAQAQSIIDLVRKVQALESGKLALEMAEHPLAALVQESVEVLGDRIRRKRLEVRVDIPATLEVRVERASFVNSVVNNLLTNAIKFSERGARIEITAAPVEGGVELLVRDHGIGMPRPLLESVFDEFKSTHRDGTSGEGGTGFGMPLVRKFVLAYGGEIRVESAEAPAADQGTVIRVKLKGAA